MTLDELRVEHARLVTQARQIEETRHIIRGIVEARTDADGALVIDPALLPLGVVLVGEVGNMDNWRVSIAGWTGTFDEADELTRAAVYEVEVELDAAGAYR